MAGSVASFLLATFDGRSIPEQRLILGTLSSSVNLPNDSGYSATLISVRNTEGRFENTCPNVQAELKFVYTPKAVPIKILFPLLEGASLEENEDLHTMWAALLANAASPTKSEMVRPGFIAIMRQMAPDEAVLLKGIVELTDGHRSFLRSFRAASKQDLDRAIVQDMITRTSQLRVLIMRTEEDRTAVESRFQTCLALLDNAGLISVGPEHGVSTVMASDLGGEFMEACSPPKPKT
jgi:hypothetical protein